MPMPALRQLCWCRCDPAPPQRRLRRAPVEVRDPPCVEPRLCDLLAQRPGRAELHDQIVQLGEVLLHRGKFS